MKRIDAANSQRGEQEVSFQMIASIPSSRIATFKKLLDRWKLKQYFTLVETKNGSVVKVVMSSALTESDLLTTTQLQKLINIFSGKFDFVVR